MFLLFNNHDIILDHKKPVIIFLIFFTRRSYILLEVASHHFYPMFYHDIMVFNQKQTHSFFSTISSYILSEVASHHCLSRLTIMTCFLTINRLTQSCSFSRRLGLIICEKWPHIFSFLLALPFDMI